MDDQTKASPRGVRLLVSLLLVALLIFQSSWFFTAMCFMAAAMVLAGYSGDRRDWLIWIGMLVGFALFAELRARMGDAVEARPFFLYVIQLETLGGRLGVASVWLQEYVQPSFLNRWGVLDAFLTTVYLSFFLVPQAIVVYLWWKGGPFLRYVVAACLLFAGALLVHFYLPTAPPWMASQEGLIGPLERIGVRVLSSVSATLTEGGYQASANDVAAMPSVHQGLTVLAMIALADLHPRTRWIGWTYGGAMLLAITYLGDHYAVDGIAGAALAWGAWRVAGLSRKPPEPATNRRPRIRPNPGVSGPYP